MGELKSKIESYFSSGLRMPLFIALPDNEYRALLEEISHINKIRTSDFCLGDDKEPDLDSMRKTLQATFVNSIVLGFGDYLELRPDFAEDALSDIKSLSLQCNIAFLLPISMRDKLQMLAKRDPRIRGRVICSPTGGDKFEDLTHVSEIENYTYAANGIKEYLTVREKGEDVKNIITDRIVRLPGKNILDPNNAFAELERSFPEIKNKFSETDGTPDQWSELLNISDQSPILQIIEKDEFKPIRSTFFDNAQKSGFDGWLFFLYLKLNGHEDAPYLKYVIGKANSQAELLENAITALSDFEVRDKKFRKFYEERKALLKNSTDADMTVFKNHTRLKGADGINYLTDNTLIERKGIIESISENGDFAKIDEVYPDLSAYLQDYQFEEKVYTDYFKQYKTQKIRNLISSEFLHEVKELAVSRPFNLLPTRSSEFANISGDTSTLIFLDAFGVEYLGYVKTISAQLGMHFEVKITRCNLPSSTEFNKEFFNEWKGKKFNIKDLDEVKHHPESGYDYNNEKLPIHLADELDIVAEALKRAKLELLQGKGKEERVIISSDHGASRLAVIAEDVFIPNNDCQVKSSGRYCEGIDLPTSEYITKEDKFAMIADYSRFDGSRKAAVEVHGGATLEEVLVPIITLTLSDKNLIIKVELESDIIETSYKKSAELSLSISPDYDNVSLSVKGKTYYAEKIFPNHYKVVMDDLKIVGNYTAQIYENQNLIATKEFTVKKQGFAEKDLF